MSEYWDDPQYQPSPSEVAIDYIKAPLFASHWADGALGGVTPGGCVHFSFYVERQAMPRRMVFELGDEGSLGEENRAKRYSRGSIVRELSCDVIMSPEVAEQLGNQLLALAKQLSAAQPASTEEK